MKLSDFYYDLPASMIAQVPADPRDHSRLLILGRPSAAFQNKRFYEIVEFLKPGDVLVINATRVFPARLRGRKKSGGKIEVLFLDPHPAPGPLHQKGKRPNSPLPLQGDSARNVGKGITNWRALVRGATRPTDLIFAEGLEARMTERSAEGEWVLEFSSNHLRDYLDRHGEMPLPPYIKRAAPQASDLNRYQTVFAQREGAVAAPTAGFHFTDTLLEKIRGHGVAVLSLILHVGWGTFRPVRTDVIEQHKMLPESYEVSEPVAQELNRARKAGRRIIAVGTTAVRTLETVCDSHGVFQAGQGTADLFIYPGYTFKGTDALVTNFHLPDSTPLLLANAFYSHKYQKCPEFPFVLKAAYQEARSQGYRFYSYGDAMFIQ